MKKRDFSAKSLFLRYELLLFACVFLLIIGILAYTNYSYQRNLENTTGTTVRYYINSKEEMMSNVEHVLFNIAANDYSFHRPGTTDAGAIATGGCYLPGRDAYRTGGPARRQGREPPCGARDGDGTVK